MLELRWVTEGGGMSVQEGVKDALGSGRRE